jgi:hypothetical protein
MPKGMSAAPQNPNRWRLKMKRRTPIFSLFFVLILALAGCGGGGIGSQNDPSGTFLMELVPDTDAEKDLRLDLELDVVDGNIKSGFARLSNANFDFENTTDVFGNASEGFIEGTADFGDLQVDFLAEFHIGGWEGSFVLRDGLKILGEGSLNIDRTGSSTRNVVGVWNGVMDFGKGTEPFTFEFFQKGNFISIEGDIDGVPVEGGGSIVGRSLFFELVPDSFIMRASATVNSAETEMEGEGLADDVDPFTFTAERE